jgi:hypothetical protein
MVEAAGVERERSAITNRLMARDFWANAFVWRQLPPVADFTDILEKHPKSTRFSEGYWRRRDSVHAADATGCSRGLHGIVVEAFWRLRDNGPNRPGLVASYKNLYADSVTDAGQTAHLARQLAA